MRELLVFIASSLSCWGAGSVNQTIAPLGSSGSYVITISWVGDASTGSVPVTAITGGSSSVQQQLLQRIQGYVFARVETSPGSPAPTNGYGMKLTDPSGADLLQAATASLSSTVPQIWAIPSSSPPLNTTFSLNITGQSAPGATATVYIFLEEPSSTTARNSSGGLSGCSPTSGSAIQKESGGCFTNALPGTDYAAPTSGNSILNGDSAGGSRPVTDAGRLSATGGAPSRVNPADYNYSVTPSSPPTLKGGKRTIKLAVCPLGLIANGVWSSVYLTAGSDGIPEAVRPTSGTCSRAILGQTGGTIVVTIANSHGPGYLVQSATAGIQEALNSATGGTTVFAPPGTYNIYAAIHVPSNSVLGGAGEANTVLFIPNRALTATARWNITGKPTVYCVICFDPGTSFQRARDFTIDANGTNQSVFIYAELYGYNASHVIVERVTVKNHTPTITGTSFQFIGHNPKTSNHDNVFLNTTFIGASCSNPGTGAYYLEGEGNQAIATYATNFCDAPYVMADCDHCGVYDSVADVGSGQMGAPTFSIEGATNSTFSGNHCIGTGTNGNYICFEVQNAGSTSSGNILANNSASHVFNAIAIGPNASGVMAGNTNQVTNTVISGFRADNILGSCVWLNQYVNKVDLSGVNCYGAASYDIVINSQGASGNTVVDNIIVDGVTIDRSQYGNLIWPVTRK